MKYFLSALLLASSFSVAGTAHAISDDTKWIAQCIKDNAEAKVTVEVVTVYCACMNELMDENETKTITEWEKTHPEERKKCEAVAGWK